MILLGYPVNALGVKGSLPSLPSQSLKFSWPCLSLGIIHLKFPSSCFFPSGVLSKPHRVSLYAYISLYSSNNPWEPHAVFWSTSPSQWISNLEIIFGGTSASLNSICCSGGLHLRSPLEKRKKIKNQTSKQTKNTIGIKFKL